MSQLHRTLIVAGCALLLPVLLVLALLVREQFRERGAQAEAAALAVAREMVTLADARLAGDLQVLRVVAQSPPLMVGDLDGFGARADAVLETIPGWTAILVSDAATGAVTFDARRGPGAGPSQPPPIPPDLTFVGHVGGVSREGAGCPCVLIQTPVPGRPGLVLSAKLDPMVFQRMMVGRVPQGAVSALVDREGDFVARSTDYPDRVGTPATEYVRAAAAAGGEGFYEGQTYEGLVNVSAYATSAMSGWSAHVAIDRGLVTGPRARAVVAMLLGSIAALSLAGVMVAYGYKDLVARRRTEARLIEMQKAEALGLFTGTVVHDFNNLLAVMQASLNLIDRTTAEPETREKVAMARDAIGRGARLTNQLLSFARQDETSGDVGEVDLAELVADVEVMLRKLMGPRIELVVRIAPDARRVLANADQIELALVNLAANARDAMERAGRVTITTERAGDDVVLRFADTGPGFAPEVLPEIFRPLFTTKPPGMGTGLGLAQVAGAVRQAGGAIAAANGPSGGAEFVLTLRAPRNAVAA